MKREPNAWGYNWDILFLADIRMGTWPSRMRESGYNLYEMHPVVYHTTDIYIMGQSIQK
jgi:hypothetical protein